MPTISQPPPLPGFGLPLNVQNRDTRGTIFANALDPLLDHWDWEARMPPLTLREIAMVQFMNKITDKQDWEHKEMANYCIEELKYTTELYAKTGFLKVYNGDVIKSDVAILSELQVALKAATAALENAPAHKQEWRPGSDKKVLDLVYPSLFSLVYGLSHILNETVGLDDCIFRCGQGKVIPEPSENEVNLTGRPDTRALYSRKFQWLPCDVHVSGDTPRIVSYINNLHPQDHKDIYSVIEKIIERVIPLWDATLTPLRNLDFPRRIEYKYVEYGNLYAHTYRHGPKRLPREAIYDFEDRCDEWANLRKNKFIVRPNPGRFVRPQTQITGAGSQAVGGDHEGAVDLKANYGATGLQIIVKLTNICLTPEKPEYGGGTWRGEGRLNEHICATAIYYYDSENITPSHLAFRQPSDIMELEKEIVYEATDMGWLEWIFGLQNKENTVQVVGSVEAREGRLVTFPNLLQHQVQSFKLADLIKPGHQKMLELFLVDPNIRILSTANIPCQRRDWWGRTTCDVLMKLPFELRDKVVEDVGDFPIGLEQAKQLREELMAERKAFADYQNERFNNVAVSLRDL